MSKGAWGFIGLWVLMATIISVAGNDWGIFGGAFWCFVVPLGMGLTLRGMFLAVWWAWRKWG